VRRADPPRPAADGAYLATLTTLAEAHGITHTGVAPATVLEGARAALLDRIRRGLTDGMQFTFRNPERSTDPSAAVAGARSIIVAARPYLLPDQERPSGQGGPDGSGNPGGPYGRIARYAWLDHYAPLRDGLWAMAHQLRADGWKAVPFADDNSIVDREVARLAGIGWPGKNANLLVQGAGSWFVLGCVVTTAPLPLTGTEVPDGCGTCRRCLDGCPTGAIIEPGVIDAARCLAWVLQKPGSIPEHLRVAVGDRLYGCDDCQEVCPPTVRLGVRHPAPPAEAPRAWVSVLRLLTLPDDDALAEWGRWYLADRDVRWIRRNALVVLGNTADPADAEVRRVLADYRAHADPLLREHAAWATERLGLEAR
jgi:epoxyqueuosine reductase